MAYAVRESLDGAVLGAWWIAAEKGRVANVLRGNERDEDADTEEETSRTPAGRCDER